VPPVIRSIPTTPEANRSVAESASASPRAEAPPEGMRSGAGRRGEHFNISARVIRSGQVEVYERESTDPLYRPLRVFALDPGASRRDGAIAVVNVAYEPLKPGPVGSLLEVVDEGLDGETLDGPLDLDAPHVLISQGRAASPTDPHFRQQMAYAVCSTAYAAFRHALGREIAWGFTRPGAKPPYRLRIRSCVSATRNAYYDPQRGELRLGAFQADDRVTGREAPKGMVCTALSHDIVAHEVSHALLDGLRARFMLPTNPDVLAFHEAFADLVALFQRFTYRDIVRAGLAASRGDVRKPGLLNQIGQEFGNTTGFNGPLRCAVTTDKRRHGDATEPHMRGEVLVYAVYEAFATVYQRKTERFFRLASNGTGVLPDGALPEILLELLTDCACKLAGHFLTICIRAIDYCPPVDITFGEFLRAAITADFDVVPDDEWSYREAWIDAFRAFGIYPSDVPSLSEDSLLWRAPDAAVPEIPELGFGQLQFRGDPGRPSGPAELTRQSIALGRVVGDPAYMWVFGLVPPGDPVLNGDTVDLPIVESIRSSRRIGPSGQVVFDLVAEVTQRRVIRQPDGTIFDFYGGTTVILNPSGSVRYTIRKSVAQAGRLAAQRAFINGPGSAFWQRGPEARLLPEPQPFCLLHEGWYRTVRPKRSPVFSQPIV
jgi:hypothetical protein